MSYFDTNEVKTQNVVRDGLPTHNFTYDYDSQHQLVAAMDGIDYDSTFSYLPGGKLDQVYVANGPGGSMIIGRDVDYTYGDGISTDKHAVTELTDRTSGLPLVNYSYDIAGNVTKRSEYPQGSWNFTYDGFDRQRRALAPDGRTELYYYDENGQRYLTIELAPGAGGGGGGDSITRTRHWFGGSEFWHQAGGYLEKAMTHVRLAGLSVARVDNENQQAEIEYSFHNGLGHLMGAADANGNITTAFVYGPYGELLEQSGETATHLRRFNGKEADQLSKLNYYGYRYYDPLSLTWTQADPLYRVAPDIAGAEPRRMSLYSFSLNNPVRYMDPDGQNPKVPNRLGVLWLAANRVLIKGPASKAHYVNEVGKLFGLGHATRKDIVIRGTGFTGQNATAGAITNRTTNQIELPPSFFQAGKSLWTTVVKDGLVLTHEGEHVKQNKGRGRPPANSRELSNDELEAYAVAEESASAMWSSGALSDEEYGEVSEQVGLGALTHQDELKKMDAQGTNGHDVTGADDWEANQQWSQWRKGVKGNARLGGLSTFDGQ